MCTNKWDSLVFIFILLLQSACSMNAWNKDMSILANYLTPFKYISKDIRYKRNKDLQKREFYKRFPRPPLKRVHRKISDNCDQGLFACVREIRGTALRSWSLQSTWFGKNGKTTPLSPMADKFHPFKTALEEFQYKTSALYYMCWFTLMRSPKLQRIMNGQNCLKQIKDSNDVLEFAKKDDGFQIEDIRTDAVPFQCAQIYFCPEPCYALKNHGLVTKGYDRKKDIHNPCFDLKTNDECSWLPQANTDMNSLMRSKLNYTCKCEENFEKGFKWSIQFKICLDTDECYDKTATCPEDQICQNTKGGYMCHCKRGYKFNVESQTCEEHFALPQAKYVSKRKIPKPAGLTFSKQVQIWLGVEDSVHMTAPLNILYVFCIVYTFIIYEILL